MLKIGLIAAVSMIAFGSLSAAEYPSSGKQDDNPDAGSAASGGEPANRGALVISGSAPAGAGGIAVSQSAVLAPAFMPVTPFATYSMSGNAVNDAELQKGLPRTRYLDLKLNRIKAIPGILAMHGIRFEASDRYAYLGGVEGRCRECGATLEYSRGFDRAGGEFWCPNDCFRGHVSIDVGGA